MAKVQYLHSLLLRKKHYWMGSQFFIRRSRRTVEHIYRCLGSRYFRRAYRLSYESFQYLHEKLSAGIAEAIDNLRPYERRGGRGGHYKPPPVRHGLVSTSVRLACALRYFAGGSPYDIMAKYGLSHASLYESIWAVVEAVNTFDEFDIEYPSSEMAQLKIAEEFEKVSEVKFNNCAGAIDGILIWILKPSEEDANDAGCGRRKFFCGRKGKFGLNCQAVSDVRGRILDLSIGLPGASSDCIAFEGSDLYERLEGGLLKNGLVLYGDNAYINTRYMATPFPNVSSGSKDDYNFFQSQLRIRVKCAYGPLVSRWGILRSAMPLNITIVRTVAMVNCLARLHNFCIDEADRFGEVSQVEEQLPLDLENMLNNPDGYVPLTMDDNHDGIAIPTEIMDAGHHFDDCPRAARRGQRTDLASDTSSELPRTILLNHVVDSHKTRPHTNAQIKKKTKPLKTTY